MNSDVQRLAVCRMLAAELANMARLADQEAAVAFDLGSDSASRFQAGKAEGLRFAADALSETLADRRTPNLALVRAGGSG